MSGNLWGSEGSSAAAVRPIRRPDDVPPRPEPCHRRRPGHGPPRRATPARRGAGARHRLQVADLRLLREVGAAPGVGGLPRDDPRRPGRAADQAGPGRAERPGVVPYRGGRRLRDRGPRARGGRGAPARGAPAGPGARGARHARGLAGDGGPGSGALPGDRLRRQGPPGDLRASRRSRTQQPPLAGAARQPCRPRTSASISSA
jgi:hypothetical protein